MSMKTYYNSQTLKYMASKFKGSKQLQKFIKSKAESVKISTDEASDRW